MPVVPAPPHVDDWVVGDTLKDFEYVCYKADGTTWDFTATPCTARLQMRSRDNPANKVDAAGGTAAGGVLAISSLGTVLTLSAGKRREVYEGRWKVTRTSDAKVGFTDWFSVGVVAVPV